MKKLIRITTVPYSMGSLLKDQFRFMSNYFEVIGIAAPSPKEYLARISEEQGIRTISVNLTRKITPFKDLKAIIKLYIIFKKERPYIVHTHTPKAGMAGMISAYLAKVPHRLHTVAGLPLLETSGLKRKLLGLIEKTTYACATKVYPNSFGLSDIIIDEGFAKAKKIKVLGNGSSNGIDTNHYRAELFSEDTKQALRSSLKLSDKDFIFIFVGRLVKDKGITELVSAFNRLSLRDKNLKLILVGYYEKKLDPLDKTTLEIIKKNEAIILTGPQEDVRPYFAISHLFVFPSYREGFPNAVMEAGAMGLPSIVTNINGCNEIIVECKNGLLIPPKNESELLKTMAKLYNDKPLLRKLAGNSRQMISSRFERRYLWSKLLEEYHSLEDLAEPTN